MVSVCVLLLTLLLAPPAIADGERKLELRGEVVPPFGWTPVVIQATNRNFRKQTFTSRNGKFKFKKLVPGHYTVYVFHRRWGETRKSVEVTPSLADPKGRVQVRIVFRRTQAEHNRQLRRRHVVSFDELSVSREARKQYRKAANKLRENRIDSAVAYLEKAVEVSPQFLAAWNQLGVIAFQMRDFQKAEEYFRKAVDIDQESFPPLLNLGAALVSLDRFDEALTYNSSAVRLRPSEALANTQLGINHFHLGNNDEAIRYLTMAKRLDPAHLSLPQLTLAEIYARQGRWEQAASELKDLRSRHPDSQIAEFVSESLEKAEAQAREAGNDPAAVQPPGDTGIP